jgi:hypothetical protein
MHPRFPAATILLIVSLIVSMIGYRIGTRKQLSLIAGLDESKVRDCDGLARWVGTGLLRVGALELLISLALFAVSDRAPLLILAYVVVSLVGAVALLVRMPRYLA